MSRYCLFLVCVVLLGIAKAQNAYTVEGHIRDRQNGEPVPYARVYALDAHRGTLSNENGFFSLEIPSYSDTLRIYILGYKTQYIPLRPGKENYSVSLEIKYQEEQAVTVSADENAFLYRLLHRCAKKNGNEPAIARSYYELKSYAEGRQVELVECFYNALIKNNNLEELALKTGRCGASPYENHLFLSLENSRAIARMKLTEHNDFFPVSPLEFNARKMQKAFFLTRLSAYVNEHNDSIYVIRFTPRGDSTNSFSGKIWVDPKNYTIYRIDYACKNAGRHPFMPVFPDDTIKRLDLRISKTFEKENGKMRFQNVNFQYAIHYADRNGAEYSISTRALLYFYDYQNPFHLPHFKLHRGMYGDYRDINAMPYNAFFWENNREIMLHAEHAENTAFLEDPQTVSKRLFEQSQDSNYRISMEHPYIHWSAHKRIRFRESVRNLLPTSEHFSTQSITQKYDFSVQLFADRTPIGDSIVILTETILDPFESYFYLPIDQKALCFMNIYFDLCEMLRRELETGLMASDRSAESFDRICAEYDQKLLDLRERYFRETDRGTNQAKTEVWNELVRNALHIDNIELFQPYAAQNERRQTTIGKP